MCYLIDSKDICLLPPLSLKLLFWLKEILGGIKYTEIDWVLLKVRQYPLQSFTMVLDYYMYLCLSSDPLPWCPYCMCGRAPTISNRKYRGTGTSGGVCIHWWPAILLHGCKYRRCQRNIERRWCYLVTIILIITHTHTLAHTHTHTHPVTLSPTIPIPS